MKLSISGNINEYYVQTLCMIFFPGEKFSEKAEEDPEVATPSLSLTLEENEDGVKVIADLSLEEKYAMPVYLYYYEGYTTGEIATMLATKPSTIHTRLAKARELLKMELE